MSESSAAGGSRRLPPPSPTLAATPPPTVVPDASALATASPPATAAPLQPIWSPNTKAAVTGNGRITTDGVESAHLLAGFKSLEGGTKIDTSSGLTITNDTLTAAQFKLAIETAFGKDASLAITASGTFTASPSSAVDAFKEAHDVFAVSPAGIVSVKPGKSTADLQLKAQRVFGSATVVSDGKVVLVDNVPQSIALNHKLVAQFGDNAAIAATLKATDDRVKNIRSAESTAALTALVGSTRVKPAVGGSFTITNDSLTQAQFKNALETTFGQGTKLTTASTYTYTPATGVSRDHTTAVHQVIGSMTLDAHGQLTVKDGHTTTELGGHVKQALGQNTVLVGGNVRFKDNAFQSADLNRNLVAKFGKSASLSSTLKSSIDREGAISAETAIALKSLMGGTTIDTSAGLTITNNTLTKAQFGAALKRVLGPKAEVSGSGAFVWARGTDGKIVRDATATFKAVHDNVTLDANGHLTLKDGVVAGDATAKITALLGSGVTIGSAAALQFKGSRVTSAVFTESLQKKYGDGTTVGGSVKATVTEEGLTEIGVGLEAFKQLKTWGKDGHLDVAANGNVTIKDGHVTAGQVEAMLTAVAGTDVKIGVGGKLQYAEGKPRVAEFNATFAKAWDNSKLEGSGKLRLVDGKPEASAHVSALFNGTLNATGDLAIAGANSIKVNAKLSQVREGRTSEISGGFSRVNGTTTLTGQTKLISTGDSPIGISVGGLISTSDTAKVAQLKTELTAGKFTGALGVGVSSAVKVYTPGPSEPGRKAVVQAGGVWAERSTTYDLTAGAGVKGSMVVGPATVSLGFKADAEKKREVHLLTSHESKEAALREGPVTVIHPPSSLEAVRAMKPYEQFSDSGTQSIGLGGNVSVGYGVGPASVSVGGLVYYQVTGTMARDIERLEGDKVRVRFRQQDGAVDVKAFSASVGVSGSKVLPDNALGKAVSPLVESVAQAGFKASVEKSQQAASLFDVVIDLSTPRGQAAMQNVLKNDLSEAQYWSRFPGSGVTLKSSVNTSLEVSTKKVSANLATLNAEKMTQWLEKTKTELTTDAYSFTQAVDYTQKADPFWPWQPTRMSDVRFLNRRTLDGGAGELPDVGPMPAADAPMSVRVPPAQVQPTLENSRALLGVRVKITDAKSSLSDVSETLGAAINVMDAVGYKPEAFKRFSDFRQAVESGVVPDRKPLILGLGDKRFGETSLDLEGYVGPEGLKTIFNNADGTPRTHADYQRSYLDAAALTGDGSVVSDGGLRAAIEKKLKASLVAQKAGEYAVVKDGATIGTLSPADFAELRKTIDGFTAPMTEGEAPWYQEVRAKVGTWVGKPPRAMFDLDTQRWAEVNAVRSRSDAFATAMEKAAALRAENAPKPDGSKGPLFDKPDAYFNELNDLFEKTVRNDGNRQTAALTMLTLAGKEGIYTRAAFSVPKETSAQMIDAARGTIQRFGAAALLADSRPAVTAGGDIEFATGADAAMAERLAKAVFGAKVTVKSSGGRSTVSFPEKSSVTPERKESVVKVLSAGRDAEGRLRVPDGWSAAQTTRFMRDALGVPTVVIDGNVVFDNRGYQGISIGDALSGFGADAFGARAAGKVPARFPVSSSVENEKDKQDPNAFLQFMVAKHKGASAAWGDSFDDMAYLRTRKADLAKPDPITTTSWVLAD